MTVSVDGQDSDLAWVNGKSGIDKADAMLMLFKRCII